MSVFNLATGVRPMATASKASIVAFTLLLVVPLLASADDKTEEVIKLVKQLRDKDEFVRLKAAKALGKLGADAKDALPALTDALKDEDADVRAVAKQAVATISDALDTTKKKDSLAKLERHLNASKDADEAVRMKAAGGLAKCLSDTDEIIRLKAAQGLAEMGLDAKGTLPDLATASKDTDEAVRKMAKRAIEKINAAIDAQKAEQLSATVAPLVTALKDKDVKKRLGAAEKLGSMGADAKEARELLVEMMLDSNAAIRVGAADALEKIDSKLHGYVVTIIIGQDKDHAITGIKSLGTDGKAALPALAYFFKANRAHFGQLYTAHVFFDTLVTVGGDDKRVGSVFQDALTGAPPNQNVTNVWSHVRNTACEFVNKSKMAAKDKTAALVIATRDGVSCHAAVTALGEIGPDAEAALPTLKQLKQSQNDIIRTAATEAVGKIDK
jgi:HEAT repeat protein